MNEQKKNHLWTYIILSITISAICWLVPLISAQNNGYLVPTAENFFTLLRQGFQNSKHTLLSLLYVAANFGPFVGAVIATRLESGAEGVSNLFRPVWKWRVARRWYWAVIIITGAIAVIPPMLALVLGMGSLTELVVVVPWYFYVLLFVYQFLTSGLGEEVGWRGYLLPRLFERHQNDRAIWLSGLIWAIWHYPFVVFLFSSGMSELSLGEKIPAILISLVGFTMITIGEAFIYAWLLKHSQSVFIAILFHAMANTLATIFGVGALAAGPLVMLPALIPWVIVLILQKRYGKESFLPESFPNTKNQEESL